MFVNSFNSATRYKKESKFENIIMWIVEMENPESDFEKILRFKLLNLYDDNKYSEEPMLKTNTDCYQKQELEMKENIKVKMNFV